MVHGTYNPKTENRHHFANVRRNDNNEGGNNGGWWVVSRRSEEKSAGGLEVDGLVRQ